MKTKLTLLLLAGTLLLGSCAPATAAQTPVAADASDPVHLKLGILAFTSYSPFMIAYEEGYFAEQGLDVELVDFGSTDRELLVALLAGQIDVGGNSIVTAAMNAAAQGAQIRAVADKAYFDPEATCPAEVWIARPPLLESGELDQPGGLRGKRFGAPVGGSTEYTLEILLKRSGLSLADVERVDVGDFASRVESFRSGSLDADLFTEPWVSRARNAGAADSWIPAAELFPNFPGAMVYFGPSMYARDHEVGERFLAAYLKAVRQYREGKTERNVDLLTAFTQLPREEVQAMCWPSFRADGTIDTGALLQFAQWTVDKGYMDTLVPMEDFWDPSFVKAAARLLDD